ncbi:MAG TPA: ABC transporter substrate-binding protein [Gemmatimonadales bacterium]|nr:ABC transporter substrate-binding protein [Gemmatimonadales bacterium]
MRIVSLLPAGTEIVAALGCEGYLVGISHECDYPASIHHLPRVTRTAVDSSLASSRIDAQVREIQAEGKPVIALEASVLETLAPDLILTQDLCEVCAVADGEVYRLAERMVSAPQIVPLRARDLSGILEDIRTVGSAVGMEEAAGEVVRSLERRLREIDDASHQLRRRVLCIEWLDPLYFAGHWVPELVEVAGGDDVGAKPGAHSTRRLWSEAVALKPDILLVMLCGFGVERSEEELAELQDPIAARLLADIETWVLDGNSYTSRPGPRVVDGAIRIRAALTGQQMDGLQRYAPTGARSG